MWTPGVEGRVYVVGVEALKLKTMTRGRVGHFILNRERFLSLCLSASLSLSLFRSPANVGSRNWGPALRLHYFTQPLLGMPATTHETWTSAALLLYRR